MNQIQKDRRLLNDRITDAIHDFCERNKEHFVCYVSVTSTISENAHTDERLVANIKVKTQIELI